MFHPQCTPASRTIAVDWINRSQAERRAGNGHRSLSTFALAPTELSRYTAERITEWPVELSDFNLQANHSSAGSPLGVYLRAWRRSDSQQPVTVNLELARSPKSLLRPCTDLRQCFVAFFLTPPMIQQHCEQRGAVMPSNRIATLQVFRILAALLAVFYHASVCSPATLRWRRSVSSFTSTLRADGAIRRTSEECDRV
jgi:hypothetical protein